MDCSGFANDMNAAEHRMIAARCLTAHPVIARYFDNGEELSCSHGCGAV